MPACPPRGRPLVAAGATLIAGHSAHVFHGATRRVLYDLGDFVDDYRRDPRLRNDLGLLFLVDLDARGIRRLEAIPLKLDHCYTRLAAQPEQQWITRRFTAACGALGTEISQRDGRLVANFSSVIMHPHPHPRHSRSGVTGATRNRQASPPGQTAPYDAATESVQIASKR
jgi:hypothetical protein